MEIVGQKEVALGSSDSQMNLLNQVTQFICADTSEEIILTNPYDEGATNFYAGDHLILYEGIDVNYIDDAMFYKVEE